MLWGRVQFHSYTCGYPPIPALFTEKAILSSIKLSCHLCQKSNHQESDFQHNSVRSSAHLHSSETGENCKKNLKSKTKKTPKHNHLKLLEMLLRTNSKWRNICSRKSIKIQQGGFPSGTVVKNPPANAGDMRLSPGLGRSHMPRSN